MIITIKAAAGRLSIDERRARLLPQMFPGLVATVTRGGITGFDETSLRVIETCLRAGTLVPKILFMAGKVEVSRATQVTWL